MWMAGYAARDKPAEGKMTDLWAKALVLEDPAGKRAVLITLDLVGIDRGALHVASARSCKRNTASTARRSPSTARTRTAARSSPAICGRCTSIRSRSRSRS